MSGADIGTDASAPVEIIQTVLRKRWTPAQKMSMVEESMKPGLSVSRRARQNGISPDPIYKWRRLVLEGGSIAVGEDEPVVIISEVKAL
ncbi:MAG: transposase [Desulfovibrio sp.]|nr:transposase [Desulfovibrio sp.]